MGVDVLIWASCLGPGPKAFTRNSSFHGAAMEIASLYRTDWFAPFHRTASVFSLPAGNVINGKVCSSTAFFPPFVEAIMHPLTSKEQGISWPLIPFLSTGRIASFHYWSDSDVRASGKRDLLSDRIATRLILGVPLPAFPYPPSTYACSSLPSRVEPLRAWQYARSMWRCVLLKKQQ